MKIKSLTFILALFFFAISTNAQSIVSGIIIDENGESLFGVTVRANDAGTTTNFDGSFSLEVPDSVNELECSYVGYETIVYTITSGNRKGDVISIQMEETATLLNTATVTSGKFEKPLGEVTVSLEVLQPDLIESNNATSVDDILDKVPGVTIVDGQANIRGGSGYSYGAGSRVLLLVDDIPILQADAGFPNWDDLPVENIDQIEVVKGAASALYGSSALNGIINVRTGYAKSEPELKVSVFGRTFNAPKDKAKHWWAENDNVPRESGASISYKRKIKKLDLVTSAYFLDQIEHNKDTYAKYGRFTLNTRYRATDKLTFGFSGNINSGKNQSFFFWQDAEAGGLLPGANTISNTDRTRFNIDPFITYLGENGIKHKLQGRYYNVNNQNNNNQSNASQLGYAEYQFQKSFDAIPLVLTTGIVYTGTKVDAPLYGDTIYTSRNTAAYFQADYKLFDKLNISGGARYEANQLNNPGFSYSVGDSTTVIKPSKDIEGRPVFRLGMNYELGEATFLRASWGQGYRYPTIAEKYIVTVFGGIPITPNPDLTSETGFSTEIGIKQGFLVSGFNGFVDVSAFWSEYNNMMEFNLGQSLFIDGFQSRNVGDTAIKGAELSIAGQGEVGGAKLSLLAGYTFLDPKFKEFDTSVPGLGETPTEAQLNAANSSADINILKYRSRHSAKLDGQLNFDNGLLFGASVNFNSNVEAIDNAFQFIIPGIEAYREANQQGNTVVSARLGYTIKEHYRFTLVGNNLLNAEYSNRPGLLEAPRNISLRFDYTL